jgi:hypothetical protein
MSETEEEFNKRIQFAKETHERRREYEKTHATELLSYANLAMRAPALVAVGGVATLLGFYSANHETLSKAPENLVFLNHALACLFWSLMLSVVSPGAAYLSQAFYIEALRTENYTWEQPFVVRPCKGKVLGWTGSFFRVSAIGLVVGAIAFLGYGGYLFLSLVD